MGCVFTIRSREKISSVRFFPPHLSSSKLPKKRGGVMGIDFFPLGLEYLRVRQPPPWHGQHFY